LNLISEYNSRLSVDEKTSPETKVQEFINFLPVLCFDGTDMKELNASELLDIAVTGVASTMLAKRWQSPFMVDVGDFVLEKLLGNSELLSALEKIEGFRNLSQDLSRVITSEKSLKKLKKDNPDRKKEEIPETEQKEKKENQNYKKELRKKLLQFITKVPIFMYLTDNREVCLKDVITEIEPELFTLVTGLKVRDFEKLCEIGVFNDQFLNSAIFAFKRFEESSLVYAGGKVLKSTDIVGGWDVEVYRSELDLVMAGVS
jgi:hypothetical protein